MPDQAPRNVIEIEGMRRTTVYESGVMHGSLETRAPHGRLQPAGRSARPFRRDFTGRLLRAGKRHANAVHYRFASDGPGLRRYVIEGRLYDETDDSIGVWGIHLHFLCGALSIGVNLISRGHSVQQLFWWHPIDRRARSQIPCDRILCGASRR